MDLPPRGLGVGEGKSCSGRALRRPARASAAHRRRTSAPLPLWFVATFAGEGFLLADRRTVRGHHLAMQEASSSRAVVMAIWLRSAPKKSESRRPLIRSMTD